MQPTALTGNFTFPNRYRIGIGRRSEIARETQALGLSAPLIITDRGIAPLPWFGELCRTLESGGLRPGVFFEVRTNPGVDAVEQARAAFKAGQHDGVIAVGGGSAIDVAKVVAVVARHDGHPFDYEYAGGKWKAIDPARVVPLLAVPTTAGTGSECSNGAVITDPAASIKRTYAHPGTVFFPRTVIADPELTFGLPAAMTAATGMDAITHCFEALCSPMYHPMADGIALEGLRLSARYLPLCYREPNHGEARTQMLMAASMAAVAFQKGLGLVHAMVHPLGAATDIHHGLGNAILLPYVMTFYRSAIEGHMERLGRVLGHDKPGFDSVHRWVLDLRRALDIPDRLHGVAGITDPQLADKLAPRAMEEKLYLATAPGPVTEAQVRDLYRTAITGR